MSEQKPDVIDVPSTALARRDSVLLMPVMDVNTALARLKEFQAFCAQYLHESQDGGQDSGDYGVIPGTKKKVLLKSGAEKLCEIYGLADEYVIINQVENWETGLFAYTIRCILKSRRDDSIVGEGLGSCSSYESKYRWREQQKSRTPGVRARRRPRQIDFRLCRLTARCGELLAIRQDKSES